jgi:DNA helicase II / ATP-dependent DNA helicase PcrA
MASRREVEGQLTLPEPLLRDDAQLREVMGVPFSAEQLDAITAPMEPAVVVAGAGSGKTAVMTARVVWLVGTGQVEAGQVLGLTFTNKAAAELGSRVRTALRRLAQAADQPRLLEEDGEPTVSTYHAYAGGLIVEHGLRLGFEPDLRLVEDATRFQVAARAVAGYSGLLPDLPSHLPTLVRDVIELDNQLLDHLVDVEAARTFDDDLRKLLERHRPLKDVVRAVNASRARDQLLDLVVAYRAAKAEAGVIEFADQMAQGARLAIECPEVSILERERFRVVLLDEYQDTSVSQRRMLQGLYSGSAAGAGLGHPVTAVGDPCQGIYGWRGASVDNIDDFPRHFPRSDGGPAVRHRLGVNRRCAVRVLDAANDVAGRLYAAHEGAEPLRPRDAAPPGRLRVALHDTVVDEIHWVADQVAGLPDELAGADGQPIPWSDIAVLVRDRQEIAELSAALRGRGIPVEVVGLSGLLIQPEVTDVVATLRAVSDLTANAAVLRLLSGPRWRIGVRDLALLGERAKELARAARPERAGLDDALDAAVSGVDPTEILSLSEAVAEPGELAYSDAARERFAALTAELTMLRRHAGEPLVELTRRVIDTLSLDVELAAQSGLEAEQARDNLALLVETVAGFVAREPRASLPALLAYLDAEAEFNRGIELATPTATDSVKLLTVHMAKGLEWRAVVLPFVCEGVFPSAQGRPRWPWVPSEVPGPLRGDADALPRVGSWDTVGFREYGEACREVALLEEQRLGYVAVTRAKEVLVASAHWWGRIQTRPRGPSALWRQLSAHVERPPVPMADPPAEGVSNPVVANRPAAPFPGRLDEARLERRRRAAAAVRDAMRSGAAASASGVGTASASASASAPASARASAPASTPASASASASASARASGSGESDAVAAALARIDAEIEPLLAEAAAATADRVEVGLPPALSATTVQRLRDDPDRLARELARPMPRPPSAAARFGTRFHAWIEAHFGQQTLWDPTDLPGRADSDIDDDADLAALIEAFRAGPYGERAPYAVEAPFALLLGGQVVRGRIDAVYETADGFDVVDWKTNRSHDADPLQLAIYRLAWAELHELPLERVGAAFYYVRSGELVRPETLADRAELERLVTGAD